MWHIPPQIPFLTINSITIVIKSNFTSVAFKAAYHVNPGAEKKLAGSR